MFEYNAYDDLNAVIDCNITISPELTVDKVILKVNCKEIELDDATAQLVYDALEVRISQKIDTYIDDMNGANLIAQHEHRMQMKMEGF